MSGFVGGVSFEEIDLFGWVQREPKENPDFEVFVFYYETIPDALSDCSQEMNTPNLEGPIRAE